MKTIGRARCGFLALILIAVTAGACSSADSSKKEDREKPEKTSSTLAAPKPADPKEEPEKTSPPPPEPPAKEAPMSLKKAAAGPDPEAGFSAYYTPTPVPVSPSAPQYILPLKPEQIQNWEQVAKSMNISDGARQVLVSNGLVGMYKFSDDVAKAYSKIKQDGVPIFVTSDSVAHLYHLVFDTMLMRLEQKNFAPALKNMSRAMQEELVKRAQASQGMIAAAYWKAAGLFSVGLLLQDPGATVPPELEKRVRWEVERINRHAGISNQQEAEANSLCHYQEDYSQYLPRGHYTESEDLKAYFKAMMWYGRISLLVGGSGRHGSGQAALVCPMEAKIQTLAAAAIAGVLADVKVDDKSALEVWQRIYPVTAFYSGFSDDLGVPEYRAALAEMFGESFTLLELEPRCSEFQKKISAIKKPMLLSQTGEIRLVLDDNDQLIPADQESLNKINARAAGFRLMGQRYIPDSHILGQLVAPYVQTLTGEPCFTTVEMAVYGPARGFPRGLDLFAALGSDRAKKILDETGDSKYQGYDETLAELQKEFSGLDEKSWRRSLYWAWLHALKTLATVDRGEGYPAFMNTEAWADKQLHAALGSWTALRHDAILYAKPSYTPAQLNGEPVSAPENPPPGYVEPAAHFYAELISINRMLEKGLEDMKLLEPAEQDLLKNLDQLLTRLLEISVKELENRELTPEEYDFIADFDKKLGPITGNVTKERRKTVLVADVHTDQNSREVLEEATGKMRLFCAVYRLPQGNLMVGCGPAYTYYEFRWPLDDRLTDEKWREIVDSGQEPPLPEWTESFVEF